MPNGLNTDPKNGTVNQWHGNFPVENWLAPIVDEGFTGEMIDFNKVITEYGAVSKLAPGFENNDAVVNLKTADEE